MSKRYFVFSLLVLLTSCGRPLKDIHVVNRAEAETLPVVARPNVATPSVNTSNAELMAAISALNSKLDLVISENHEHSRKIEAYNKCDESCALQFPWSDIDNEESSPEKDRWNQAKQLCFKHCDTLKPNDIPGGC